MHQLARVVHNSGPSHIEALDHVLRYLAATFDLCLIVGNCTPADLQYPAGFQAYVNASHKNTELNFRGITGICIFCFGTIMLSRMFDQNQVAAYSCEAEYFAYSSGVKDVEYIRLLLSDLLIFDKDTVALTMLVDSEPAITVAQGPSQRSFTKHIDFTIVLCCDYVCQGFAQ